MARTTPDKVEGVLNKDYDYKNRPSLDPYIDWANLVVSRLLVVAAEQSISIGAPTAEMIERCLAAHGYVQSDATHTSRSNLDASASFNKDQEAYLKMAKMVDPTGLLAAVMSGVRVQAFWLGKNPSDQLPYSDRR